MRRRFYDEPEFEDITHCNPEEQMDFIESRIRENPHHTYEIININRYSRSGKIYLEADVHMNDHCFGDSVIRLAIINHKDNSLCVCICMADKSCCFGKTVCYIGEALGYIDDFLWRGVMSRLTREHRGSLGYLR